MISYIFFHLWAYLPLNVLFQRSILSTKNSLARQINGVGGFVSSVTWTLDNRYHEDTHTCCHYIRIFSTHISSLISDLQSRGKTVTFKFGLDLDKILHFSSHVVFLFFVVAGIKCCRNFLFMAKVLSEIVWYIFLNSQIPSFFNSSHFSLLSSSSVSAYLFIFYLFVVKYPCFCRGVVSISLF